MTETEPQSSAGSAVAKLRRRLGLSQADFARRIGLNSKSRVSELENTGRCSLRSALAIEELSDGAIAAEQLSDDVAAARRPLGRAATVTSAAAVGHQAA